MVVELPAVEPLSVKSVEPAVTSASKTTVKFPAMEPVTMEPVTMKPVTMKPAAMEPAAMEPAAVKATAVRATAAVLSCPRCFRLDERSAEQQCSQHFS